MNDDALEDALITARREKEWIRTRNEALANQLSAALHSHPAEFLQPE